MSSIKNIFSPSLARKLKSIFLRIRGLFYRGSKYYCNICDKSFRKFIKGGFDLDVINEKQIIGAGIRDHICPNCQSTDRDRLIKLFFDESKILKDDKLNILHIAPEPALNRLLSKLRNVNYVPAAKYHEGIYYPEKLIIADLTDLHFTDGEFDIVICNHVLEHVDKDTLAFSEIYRVLRKGGLAILQVPYSNLLEKTIEDPDHKTVEEREKHYGQFDHLRLYGKDYEDKLEAVGFNIGTFMPDMENQNTRAKELSLFKDEKLFVVSKPKKL